MASKSALPTPTMMMLSAYPDASTISWMVALCTTQVRKFGWADKGRGVES
jgi:hypothetical protein